MRSLSECDKCQKTFSILKDFENGDDSEKARLIDQTELKKYPKKIMKLKNSYKN